jgi:CheY-like chemotaxis protein
VEDNPTHLKLACQVLIFDGHSVNEVPDAEHVFESIRKERPDVVLLDLALPGIDGLTLVRGLKADPVTRDIQVVAMTSYCGQYSRSAAMEAGCDAYIRKPIDTRSLSSQLRALKGA